MYRLLRNPGHNTTEASVSKVTSTSARVTANTQALKIHVVNFQVLQPLERLATQTAAVCTSHTIRYQEIAATVKMSRALKILHQMRNTNLHQQNKNQSKQCRKGSDES